MLGFVCYSKKCVKIWFNIKIFPQNLCYGEWKFHTILPILASLL